MTEIKEILKAISTQLCEISSQSKTWLTVDEVADYLGLTTNTVYQYVSQGRIPFNKLPNGRKLLFNRQELDRWIVSGRQETAEDRREFAERFLEETFERL